jgi:transglutaminase-like putative cysteine protease
MAANHRLPRPVLVSALLAAALLPARPAACAPGPWNGPSFSADPAALVRAASAVPGGQGEEAVVLLFESTYRYDEAQRETFTQRIVYRVLAAATHPSWSFVEERWSPRHQSRPVIRARVLTPDGAEHRLDPAAVTDAAVPGLDAGGRVLRAPLPAIRPGAVVEQEVTIREIAPFFDRGVVRRQELEAGAAVRHARVVVDAPVRTPLRWVVRGWGGPPPVESVAQGRRRVVFEWDLTAPALGLTPAAARSASIAFSTGRSWAEIARRYSEIVDQAIQGSDLRSFLRAAGGPAASQLDLIRRYVARVSREIRYTAVQPGVGRLIPRKPAETLRRGLGDCKDKAVLLTAILRAAEIPAYVALLSAGEGEPDVEGSLPGLGAFNHAIVVVPGNPAIWIDPTDPDARPGELPAGDQGRLALIASPSTTGLVRTPQRAQAGHGDRGTR